MSRGTFFTGLNIVTNPVFQLGKNLQHGWGQKKRKMEKFKNRHCYLALKGKKMTYIFI